jgi:hypothetical protein
MSFRVARLPVQGVGSEWLGERREADEAGLVR